MIQRRDRSQAALLICLALLYLSIFAFLRTTTLYDVEGGHNDRLFSADDLYYVTEFFSAEMDDSPRIIKHPLLVVFGWAFTRLERLLLGAVSVRRHYQLIVLGQMCASILTTCYLGCILTRHYKIDRKRTALLCAVYALAFSTLFYTFVAESYILSALVLMMSYYYAQEDRPVLMAVLGVLAAGITITNAALWAIIVLFSAQPWRRRAAVLFSAGAAFCIAVALTPARTVFFSTFLSGALGSAHNYSDHFPLPEAALRVFFMIFCAPLFYLDTANTSPFGDFSGDALSFLPAAPWYLVLAGLSYLALLVYSAAAHRTQRSVWAPAGVLAANLVLHGLIQYGLKEGFLYCQHHLGAQLLIAACALSPQAGKTQRRVATTVMALVLCAETAGDLPGYRALLAFLMR